MRCNSEAHSEAKMMKRLLTCLMALMLAGPVFAQSGPLRLTITDGVIEPITFAAPSFQAENPAAAQVAIDPRRRSGRPRATQGLVECVEGYGRGQGVADGI